MLSKDHNEPLYSVLNKGQKKWASLSFDDVSVVRTVSSISGRLKDVEVNAINVNPEHYPVACMAKG